MDDEDKLPEGWSKHWSTTWKKHYYFNPKDNKQQWDVPSKPAAKDPPPAPKPSISESQSRLAPEPKPRDSSKASNDEDIPEIAVLRHKEVQNLEKVARELCSKSSLIMKETGSLPRTNEEERARDDVLIPSNVGIDPCLHRELFKAGCEEKESKEICEKLSQTATDSAQALQEAKTILSRTPQSFVSELVEKELQNRQIELTWRDTSLVINREHYVKLQKLYETNTPDAPQLFKVRLFCLLQRYTSVGGAGYQAAIPQAVFDVIQQDFDVTHECFASPLNQTLQSYNSAFYDTDRFFGSYGTFFDLEKDLWKSGGSFEANPPFTEECMQLMSETIEHILEVNDKKNIPSSYLVIVPAWTDERAHEVMRESRFLRKHLFLEKGQHSYRSGAQHKVLQQYHDAGLRTSLFFLQNDAGASKWPVTKDAISRIEAAFRSSGGPTKRPRTSDEGAGIGHGGGGSGGGGWSSQGHRRQRFEHN